MKKIIFFSMFCCAPMVNASESFQMKYNRYLESVEFSDKVSKLSTEQLLAPFFSKELSISDADEKFKYAIVHRKNILIDIINLHKKPNVLAVLTDLLNSDWLQLDKQDVNLALLQASSLGACEFIVLLLNKGAEIENFQPHNKKTPLIWAVENGHTQAITFLLDNGANIEAKDVDKNTALLRAVKKGSLETVSVLLERGANIEAIDKDNNTALIWAANNGYVDITSMLLDKGVKIDVQGNIKRTALMWGVAHRKVEATKILLERGVQLDIQDETGKTALMLASELGCVDIVKILLEKGANPKLKSAKGYTALDLATMGNKKECKTLLKTYMPKKKFLFWNI